MKIPMPNRPGLIEHRSAAVPRSGAPDMNFGLETARSLGSVADAVMQTGRAVGHLAAREEQVRQQQQTAEDRLAAAQDRNLLEETQEGLRQKLAENPNAEDAEKRAWIQESLDSWNERRQDLIKNMSSRHRALHDEEMRGLAARYAGRQRELLTQGAFTRIRNGNIALLDRAAARGDAGEYKRILDEGRGTVFSEEEYKARMGECDRLTDLSAARYILDGNTPDFLEELLLAKNDDGSYANFTALSSADRERLAGAARTAAARIEARDDQRFIASLNMGEPLYDQDSLEKARQRGEITLNQYNRYKSYLSEYEARRKRAVDYQASQKEKAVKAARQQQVNELLVNVSFDEYGRRRQITDEQAAEARRKLQQICGRDYDMFQSAAGRLQTEKENKAAYRESAAYKAGEDLISGFEVRGKLTAGVPGRFYGTNPDDRPVVKTYLKRQLTMDLENYCRSNPKTTVQEVCAYLEKRCTTYNQTTVDDIAAMTMRERSAKDGERKAGTLTPGTEKGGYVYTGGDPANKNSWKRKTEK